jgi:hypothetical protein
MSLKKSPAEKIGSVAPFGLRMLPDLKEKIENAAAKSGRSLNAEIVHRLESSLEPPTHGNVFGVAMSLSDEDRQKAAILATAMESLLRSIPLDPFAKNETKDTSQGGGGGFGGMGLGPKMVHSPHRSKKRPPDT